MRHEFLLSLCLVPLAACASASGDSQSGSSGPAGYAGSGGSATSGGSGGSTLIGGEGGSASAGAPSSGGVQAGTLTAGVWDDNLNYDFFTAYRSSNMQRDRLGFHDAAHHAARELYLQGSSAKSLLDVALVIDTTGSMADELSYLQVEFESISRSIETAFPSAEQRWSLVVYRDVGDYYLTEAFDFTTDPAEFRDELRRHGAAGGGDFPEAPDRALDDMNHLGWRDGSSVARLAFWVADAPHHADSVSKLRMADAIRDSQQLGIHLYPVASSGIDENTELTMRSAAQLTGGRYLFLTDDSGVGGPHKEPTIPCYFVTRLDHAILRVIDVEMTGEYREPYEDEILRTGGDPENGACVAGGEEVQLF